MVGVLLALTLFLTAGAAHAMASQAIDSAAETLNTEATVVDEAAGVEAEGVDAIATSNPEASADSGDLLVSDLPVLPSLRSGGGHQQRRRR